MVWILKYVNKGLKKNFNFYQQLEESLNESGHKWELNPGDGAFYGPKVGIYFNIIYIKNIH